MGRQNWFQRSAKRHKDSLPARRCCLPRRKRVPLLCERLEDRLAPVVFLQYGGPGTVAMVGESTPATSTVQISEMPLGQLKIDLDPTATFDPVNSTQFATGLSYQVPGSPGASNFATIQLSNVNSMPSVPMLTVQPANIVFGDIPNANSGLGNINAQADTINVTGQLNLPGDLTLKGTFYTVSSAPMTAKTATLQANKINALTSVTDTLSLTGAQIFVNNVSPTLGNLNVSTNNGQVQAVFNSGNNALSFSAGTVKLIGQAPPTNLSIANTAGGLIIDTLAITGDVTVVGNGRDVAVVNTLSARNATLTTSTSGNILLTGTTSAAGGTVTITSAGNIEGGGKVTATNMYLACQAGLGDLTPLNLAASNISGATTNGNVVLNNNFASAVTVNSLTAAGTGDVTFNQTGGGAVTITMATANGGSIDLKNAGGDINVRAGGGVSTVSGGNITLIAFAGTITQNAQSTVNAGNSVTYTAGTGITIGTNARILSGQGVSNGNVSLATISANILMAASSSITAGSSTKGTNGSVTLIAGKSNAQNITLSSITANGANQTITVSAGNNISGQTGAVISTLGTGGSRINLTAQAGNIDLTGVSFGAPSTAVTMVAGGFEVVADTAALSVDASAAGISLNGVVTASIDVTLTTTSGNIVMNPGSSITAGNPAAGISGSVTLTANSASTQNITLGNITANQSITVWAGNSISVQTGATIQATGPSSTIQLNAGSSITTGSGAIASAGGNMALNAPTVSNQGTMSATGGITVANPSGDLTVTGNGTMSGRSGITFSATAGLVSVTQASMTGTVSGSAATSFSIASSSGGITLGNITTTNGPITVKAGSGTLSLATGATIAAKNGDLTLQNSDTAGGIIEFGQGAQVTANAVNINSNLGTIQIVIGVIPQAITAGKLVTMNAKNIDLTGSSVTAGNPAAGSAGTISLTAIQNIINPGSLRAFGSGGTGGNVTLVAFGAPGGSGSISIGSIDTSGGSLGGSVSVISAQPIIVTGDINTSGASGGGNVTLSAGGTASITQAASGSTIRTGTLNLSSGSGNISIVNTNAATLSINTAGSAAVTDSGPVTLGNLTANAPNQSISVVALSIMIGPGAMISAKGGNVSMNAAPAGAITVSGGPQPAIQAAILTLVAGGNVGSSAAPVTTNVLTLNATANGSIFLTNAGGPLTLGPSTAGGSFSLASSGNITTTSLGSVTASNIVLTSNNGNISFGAPLSGSTSVSLTANGSGAILQNLGTTISTPKLTLSSASGDIGSALVPINTSAVSMSANTSGNVSITDTASAVTIGSSSGNSFSLTAAGNIQQAPGTLLVGVSATLSTTTGDITVYGIDASGPVSLNPGTGKIHVVAQSATNVVTSGFTATRLTLDVILNSAPSLGKQFTVIDITGNGSVGGTFKGLPQGATLTSSFLGIPYFFNVNYTGGDGNDLVLTAINPATTTSVASSLNPSIFGESVTFTATVGTVASPVAPVTSGSVTFQEGSTVLGIGILDSSGAATFTTSTLSVATHNITAVYSGTASFLPSSGSFSQTVFDFAQAVANLGARVSAATIDQGIKDSLLAQLSSAADLFTRGNLQAGANQLSAFQNEVLAQKGKAIDSALADNWIAFVQRIFAVLPP